VDTAVDELTDVESSGEMKSFYSHSPDRAADLALAGNMAAIKPTRARVAVYDSSAAAPRVEEVSSRDVDEYIERLTSRVYDLARTMGGTIPYTVVREVAENFIHADFAEPVVSILDAGRTIRFADQGPGIPHKDRAMLPGFTTASGRMKNHIRGVGSGLPIVVDYLSVSGGTIEIEDNLGSGSVVTLRTAVPSTPEPVAVYMEPSCPSSAGFSSVGSVSADESFTFEEAPPVLAGPRLSNRQKQVLALILESGSAGPSIVSQELGVGLSTAYRDLASLEDFSLIEADGGKRRLTPEGMSYLSELMNA
jgi:hypothetical protein